MGEPDDIIGHKTFDTGEIDPTTGFPKLRHEPMTRAEADALWDAAEKAKAQRAETMPDEAAAIHVMFDAWQRLKELGWNDAIYCPKDGSHFKAIEPGSTGIHDCSYEGEWPQGSWWIYDGDVWPSHPILFRLYPDDEAKAKERMDAARERFRAMRFEPEHDPSLDDAAFYCPRCCDPLPQDPEAEARARAAGMCALCVEAEKQDALTAGQK